jgi:hypothetical protein
MLPEINQRCFPRQWAQIYPEGMRMLMADPRLMFDQHVLRERAKSQAAYAAKA